MLMFFAKITMTATIPSVFLPQTSFPLRGNLAQSESRWLDLWTREEVYKTFRTRSTEKPLFVLHDGPPYANGAIHIGHALDKIMKDLVLRSRNVLGYDVSFVPGWDCHGLPIEAKIEESYRNKGIDRRTVAPREFRQACRDFAEHWMKIQREDFMRLGALGDWDHPYLTMDPAFEASIVNAFFRMLMQGYVYLGKKPVMWSPVEETALAEAEVEYKEITSRGLFVRFPLMQHERTSAIIWTTTGWTIPGNRAICYKPELTYQIIRVDACKEGSRAQIGEQLLVAESRAEEVLREAKVSAHTVLATILGENLAEMTATHPLYGFRVPLLAGEHVTADSGTGLVHTAPSHGPEDFEIGMTHELEIPDIVNADGTFGKDVPVFAGQHIWKVPVEKVLDDAGMLLASHAYTHSYPHSWRSKTPLIYRTTPQWFITMDGAHDLRGRALRAISQVRWHPASSENRISAMVRERPDWCISRQRLWGVPLCCFIHKDTREVLRDPKVCEDIVARIRREGVDFWFTDAAWEMLPSTYDRTEWERVNDIIDVWFESGVTHFAVLKDRIPQDQIGRTQWPADLYSEGSDQHRGWFQSSLMTAAALEGSAPYKNVLTHGFVLDEHGNKMSKSLGNVISPQEIVSSKGADILRLWVGSCNLYEDLRIGPEILKHVEDVYRRFRNTLRYLLGGMHGLSADELADVRDRPLPALERWVRHKIYMLQREVCKKFEAYAFQEIVQELHLFCTNFLSSFYFDVRKDVLYCDPVSSPRRQSLRLVFLELFQFLAQALSPFLCFTTEEAHQAFLSDIAPGLAPETYASCLFFQPFTMLSDEVCDIEHNASLDMFLTCVRPTITNALEKARARKEIASSLQATIDVYLPARFKTCFPEDEPHEDMCLVSGAKFHWDVTAPESAFVGEEVGVVVHKAPGEKCARCWKVLTEVSADTAYLCTRCCR